MTETIGEERKRVGVDEWHFGFSKMTGCQVIRSYIFIQMSCEFKETFEIMQRIKMNEERVSFH